ncbi:MAG: hypothetical protein A2X94_01015 [Bdellovibrionales bacterium GWB1_55_8]|nr:MAG: hypothetical protein A2X94_01015 [Bdellovibrionales bacterium GWB1_55_8]
MKFTGERIPILNRGDQLREGKYYLHSSFERALNYSNAGRFISMVTPEVGSGPDSLVWCELPEDALHEIEIGGLEGGATPWMSWGGNRILLDAVPVFDSALPRFSAGDRGAFGERIQLFEHLLKKHAPERSLVFLLDTEREELFRRGFEEALLQRFRKGAGLLREQRYLECFTELRGLGWGLTPSGDDFIAGVAMALRFHGSSLDLDGATLTGILSDEASSSLSTHLIRRSFQGLICARWKTMIQTLKTGKEVEIERALLRVLDVGATSGADTSTGWLLGLRGENWG